MITNQILWWRPSGACWLLRCKYDGNQPPNQILWTSGGCTWCSVSPRSVAEDNNPQWLWCLLHNSICTHEAYCQSVAQTILARQNCFAVAESNCTESTHLPASEVALLVMERCWVVGATVFCHTDPFEFRNCPVFHTAKLSIMGHGRGSGTLSASHETYLALFLSEVYHHWHSDTL